MFLIYKRILSANRKNLINLFEMCLYEGKENIWWYPSGFGTGFQSVQRCVLWYHSYPNLIILRFLSC